MDFLTKLKHFLFGDKKLTEQEAAAPYKVESVHQNVVMMPTQVTTETETMVEVTVQKPVKQSRSTGKKSVSRKSAPRKPKKEA